MRAVVLGVGNLLLSDEGVGVRAIEKLAHDYHLPPEVELLDGGTSAMEMLDDLAHSDLLLIADCVRSGQPPGSLVRLSDEDVPVFLQMKMSPHQVGLSDVLATLAITGEYPGRVIVHGVEPASLATGMELTPAIADQLDALVDALARDLQAAGCNLQPVIS
jgi:hydrogenase maturation protease